MVIRVVEDLAGPSLPSLGFVGDQSAVSPVPTEKQTDLLLVLTVGRRWCHHKRTVSALTNSREGGIPYYPRRERAKKRCEANERQVTTRAVSAVEVENTRRRNWRLVSGKLGRFLIASARFAFLARGKGEKPARFFGVAL